MEIDQKRQQKAREYARLRRRISWTEMAIVFAAIIVVLLLGWEKWLRDVLQQFARGWAPLAWQPLPHWYPVQIAVYFLVLVCLAGLVTLPLTFYSGYTLPHRYGLSVISLRGWINDLLKGAALSLLFEICLVSLVYALLAWQPQLWWLWVAIILLFFSVVMANLAPVLIFPLFYKFKPLPEGELTRRLLALADKARTRVRGVYTMQMSNRTTTTNAALMGLGNTRRVVVGDTMLDRYTPDEIEVVLAHELGHHVHGDIWRLIACESVVTLCGLFLGNLVLHWVVDSLHYYQALTDPATMLFFALLTSIFSLVILPINNLNSRACENNADEYALQVTGKVDIFKTVMIHLANQNLAELDPSPIIEFLFYSHPSISKRLAHADKFAARQEAL